MNYSFPQHVWEEEPFPHVVADGFLPQDLADQAFSEIVGLERTLFDRYNNPFEQKWTLRDKFALPNYTKSVFDILESDNFVKHFSMSLGIQLYSDPTRHYHGVHLFEQNDTLDVHVDAGIHPMIQKRKLVTIGLYLSDPSYNPAQHHGQLELWHGDDISTSERPRVYSCAKKIDPLHNRAVFFLCSNKAWHGVPSKYMGNVRIFMTVSLLCDDLCPTITPLCSNVRTRAYFARRVDEPDSLEKDELRELRASSKAADVYRSLNTF